MLYEELNEVEYEQFIESLRIKATIKTLKLLNLVLPLMAYGYGILEKLEYSVNEVIMNPTTFAVIRKLGRDVVDMETDKEKFEKGIYCKIWGTTVVVHKKVPDDIMLVLSESDRVAVILELEVNRDKVHEVAVILELEVNRDKVHDELISSVVEIKKKLQECLREQAIVINNLYEITKKVSEN